jgi:predicted patatin/cPLA2 family phospholipase
LSTIITDTALIFEGGGMRASATAGVVVTLLEQDILFKDVYGISAGSSHTVNYVSRDIRRARESFVGFMRTPGVSGMRSFLHGDGFFNSDLIYQQAGKPNAQIPFDFATFMGSESNMHIEAYNATYNLTERWDKSCVYDLGSLMTCVQASSTLPFFMPPVVIDDDYYFDGGLGDSWGIALHSAMEDGYRRFFIVRTQERGYRKKRGLPSLPTRIALHKFPQLYARTRERWQAYNQICDEIEALELYNAAYSYHPQKMRVKNTTTDVAALQLSYDEGYEQAQHELPAWRKFLGI